MVHQPHIRCETLMDSTVARNHWNQQQLTWRIRVAQWPFSPTTNRPLSTTHRGTDVCPHYAILSPLLGFDYDGCRGPIRGSGVYETHLRQHRSSHLGKMMGWMFSQKARLESLGIPGVANKHYKYYKSWDLGFDCPLTHAHIPPTSSDLLNIQVLELVGQCSVDRAQPTHKKLHPKLHAGESPIVSTCYPENEWKWGVFDVFWEGTRSCPANSPLEEVYIPVPVAPTVSLHQVVEFATLLPPHAKHHTGTLSHPP